MINSILPRKLQEKILKDVQHNNISSLIGLKSENPNFHWCSVSYEITGDTALHIASRLGYITTIDYLLKYEPCAVNVKNKDDKTPLHEAAQFAQIDSVLRLCHYGCDINALRRGDWTALMLACTKVKQTVSIEIVKILIERGAKINISNKDGWTCAHLLAREGNVAIFDYLVEKGLDINIKTKNGRSPLHIAALHGNKEIVLRLLTYVPVDFKDGCGNTALHEAISGQHIGLAKLLINHGANVNSRNNSDLSILHLAASQDSLEVIDYILKELKYNMNCQNKNGWTAAHCAARKGSKQMLEYLREIGVDLSIKDNFGRIAMDYFLL